MQAPVVHLENISIQGFRGIPGLREPLRLDLSCPLTVILAANGTGKTSICQAAEWLVTGAIGEFRNDLAERLPWRHPAGADAPPPVVEGDVLVDRQAIHMRCNLAERVGRGVDGQGEWSDHDLLRLLAPDVVAQEKGLGAYNPRRDWLRGTQFLGLDLDRLINAQDSDIKVRRQVFADLFGIQHLQHAEKQLQDYHTQIRGPRNAAEDRYTQILNDLAQRPGPSDNGGAPSVAAQRLAQVFETLGEMKPQDVELEILADTAVGMLKDRQAALETQRAAVAFLEGLDVPLNVLETRLDETRAERSRLARHADLVQARLDRVNAFWQRQERDRAHCQARMDDLRQAWADAVVAYPKIQAGTQSQATLHQDLPQFGVTQGRLTELEARLLDFGARLSNYWDAVGELRMLENTAPGVKTPVTPDDLDQACKAYAKAEVDLRRLRERVGQTDRSMAELRAAARALLDEGAIIDGACPLCGHDWQERERLAQAIRATLEAAPAAAQVLQGSLEEAIAQEEQARAAVSTLDSRFERQKTAAGLYQTRSEIERQARDLGLPENSQQWPEYLQRLRRGVVAARTLHHLVAAQRRAEEVLHIASDPQKALSVRYGELDKAADRNRRAWDRLEDRAAQLVGTLEQELTTLQPRLFALDRDGSALADRVSRARSQWQILSKDKFTLETYGARRDEVDSEGAALGRARELLEAAQAVLRESRQEQERRDLLARKVRGEHRRRALDERLNTATSALEKVRTHRQKVIQEQLDALMPRVNSLFARVHANKVFDRILSGMDEPLRWTGSLGEIDLEPEDFSLGQRQDLALALFLARACSLRGTFFLDEPIAHLDDLNRVAVLDILRMIALSEPDVRLVITTANHGLARHILEKFGSAGPHLAQVISLKGGPREGVTVQSGL